MVVAALAFAGMSTAAHADPLVPDAAKADFPFLPPHALPARHYLQTKLRRGDTSAAIDYSKINTGVGSPNKRQLLRIELAAARQAYDVCARRHSCCIPPCRMVARRHEVVN